MKTACAYFVHSATLGLAILITLLTWITPISAQIRQVSVFPADDTVSLPGPILLKKRQTYFPKNATFTHSRTHDGRKKNLSRQIDLISALADSSNWLLTFGSWDSIALSLTSALSEETHIYYSGHFVSGKDKSSFQKIIYPTATHLRMGYRNQVAFTIAPYDSLSLLIDARQSSGLPLINSMELIPLEQVVPNAFGVHMMIQMLFMGAVFALMIYHLMLFTTTSGKAYLFFCLYMASIILHTLDYNGLLSEVLIFNTPALRPYFKALADNGISIFYMLLFRVFLDTQQQYPGWDKWIRLTIKGLVAYLVITILWIMSGGNLLHIMIGNIIASFIPILLIVTMARTLIHKGGSAAMYFLTGTGFLVLGNVINTVFLGYGLDEPTLFGVLDRVQFIQAGAFLQVIFFSVGLGIRHRETELQRHEATRLNEVKSQFIANLSHEFRTPLTLIINPISYLLESRLEQDVRESLQLVQRHASRLLVLINQLLDLSKLEAGQVHLRVEEMDLVPYLRLQIASFQSLAQSKKIDIQYHPEMDTCMAWADPDKIEKVVNNLLHNAIKFTPDGGRIRIGLQQGNYKIRIIITDSGPGIPKSALPHIFDRFYQVNSDLGGKPAGAGIGLAFSQELMIMHQGDIRVTQTGKSGTTFQISLLLGKAHFQAAEFAEEPNLRVTQTQDFGYSHSEKPNAEPAETNQLPPQILIIEDNQDLRQHLIQIIQPQFRVIEAPNGELGCELATEILPDLIISDVMMPGMDGFALCKKLKQDERTSHIPIILLTARANQQDKIQGLSTGADDYIVKPFDFQELLARVHNLIEQRKKLQAFHNKWIGPNEIVKSDQLPRDLTFMNQIKQIMQDHFHDPEFNVEQFAELAVINRRQLNRKARALFGQAPSDLIREYRLKKAALMLVEGTGNVTEVCYAVGFNNPGHFSRLFKDAFGMLPSDYPNGS